MESRVRSRRGRRDAGATLVEFAIIVPVFVLLVMASIDFVVILTNYSGLRNGAREGARAGIVGDWGTDTSCALVGAAPNATTHALMCRIKQRTSLDAADTRVKIDWTGTYSPGSPLLVCAQYPMKSMTGVGAPFLGGRVLQTKVEMRIETIDINLVKAAETALPGKSWTWCT